MAAEIPPTPSHRRPTPDHPPYAEMVQCSLTTLAEPNGSTESSISAFIQKNYTSLPWGHSKLLPYYLNKLLIAGEIQRSDVDPNFYVLPDHITSREDKPVKKSVTGVSKKAESLQGEVQVKRGRGRRRKYKGVCSEKMTVRENAEKERKGFVLKFKRKCAEGDSNTRDGSWMFSKDATQEEVDGNNEKPLALQEEGFDPVECNTQNIKNLALPAYKSSDTKTEEKGDENGSNEKDVELQKKDMKELEFNMQNENLLALQKEDFGAMKVDVNGEEMLTLQKKDCSATKIDENDETVSVLQDKNCCSSTIEENDKAMLELHENYLDGSFNGCNEKVVVVQGKDTKGVKKLLGSQEKDSGVMKIDMNGEEMLALHEKDCSAAKINEMTSVLHDQNCSSNTMTEKDDMLTLQDNYLDGSSNGCNEKVVALQRQDVKGVDLNMQNENLLALQKKDIGDMNVNVNGEGNEFLKEESTSTDMPLGNVNGEEMLVLREEDCSVTNIDDSDEILSVLQDRKRSLSTIEEKDDKMLALQENYLDGSFSEGNEKVVALQEKDANGVEFNMQNDSLLASQEKVFGAMKVNVNDEEMLARQEKDCDATKIDEMIMELQDKNCSLSIIADNGNEVNGCIESSLLEENLNVCKNEHKGSLLASQENVAESLQVVPSVEIDTPSKESSLKSEMDTSSKKSKTKKARRLWFES